MAQRLRDQQAGGPTAAWPHGKPMPSGSSAFPNYQRAEELTERNLNTNKAAVEAWIKGPPTATSRRSTTRCRAARPVAAA
ncbi:hypothetical protein ACFYNN_35970 [Streptomyces sp. NPDC006978]|uniref:hypothetical protein n=1 Tax=unclassified Streptomyces TaxID=2593676 RepID=UPI0036B0081D